jgi:hypothetical protein
VKRAEFDARNQNPGVGLGANNMPSELKRVDGGIASHEPDHGPFNRRFKFAKSNDFEIDSRRSKPGAGGDDQVGDFLASPLGDKPIDRLRGQAWRLSLVFAHARAGRGKIAAGVKPLIVERFVETELGGTKSRPATSYVRARNHSLEKKPRAPIRHHALGKLYERGMDLMVGSGDAEAVQIGVAHKLGAHGLTSELKSVATKTLDDGDQAAEFVLHE